MKPKMVLSGINLYQMGGLTVYKSFVQALIDCGLEKKYSITIFVHRTELFEEFKAHINIIEIPDSRESYLKRIYYEYFYFMKYSKEHDISIWISMHDITPRVIATHQFTYCHTSTPFYKNKIKLLRYEPKSFLVALLYSLCYRINVKSCDAFIVQQEWLRDAFFEKYPIKNVIVAYPISS